MPARATRPDRLIVLRVTRDELFALQNLVDDANGVYGEDHEPSLHRVQQRLYALTGDRPTPPLHAKAVR
jgi:hypothetical protein